MANIQSNPPIIATTPSLKITFELMIVFFSVYGYRIKITSDAPVVVGATVSFRATITDDYDEKPSGTFQFKWRDNAIPPHFHTVRT